MSCGRTLNFDQWKTFSGNYKPTRVWLWLVYKFTKNYCHLRLFFAFIQTQKRYPTSLDKIPLLTKLENHLSCQAKIVLVNLTPRELTPHKISHICHCNIKGWYLWDALMGSHYKMFFSILIFSWFAFNTFNGRRSMHVKI